MAFTPDHEGLQRYNYEDNGAQAPEVDSRYESKDPLTTYVHVVQEKKLPLGWSLRLWLTLVAVATALVIGAGVGGGLGAALVECNKSESSSPVETLACPAGTSNNTDEREDNDNDNDSSNDISTKDFYAPESPENVQNLTVPAPCAKPGNNFDPHAIRVFGYDFEYYCFADFINNDIVPIIAYTFVDCLRACAQYTVTNKDRNVTPCNAVAFNREMKRSFENWKGNCWLKSESKVPDIDSDYRPNLIWAVRSGGDE
ncbi:hypothetical protein F66182_3703 [Fusarium sp. NRRL 66182]|nr:hypothetical protein F66182_3703 [Fusarium sp. NRRL 66182]